jgi:hypothetical protein
MQQAVGKVDYSVKLAYLWMPKAAIQVRLIVFLWQFLPVIVGDDLLWRQRQEGTQSRNEFFPGQSPLYNNISSKTVSVHGRLWFASASRSHRKPRRKTEYTVNVLPCRGRTTCATAIWTPWPVSWRRGANHQCRAIWPWDPIRFIGRPIELAIRSCSSSFVCDGRE